MIDEIKPYKKRFCEPRTKLFNGHEFDLVIVTNNKSKAKDTAQKYRKRGFHLRVIELPSGMFSVYRRHKTI
jgi:hypothetical protein